jgi:uncharacterized protein YndB with AHSA1/START domain
MRKIATIITAAIVVFVVGVLVLAMTQPDSFQVQRAASIKAPPEKIFSILSDFRRSIEWSPYEKKDPNMKRAYSGAPSGKGAIYEWDGDRNVGAGRLEILDVSPASKVVVKLDISRPFEGHNIVEYKLEPKGDLTNVTWAIRGPMPFMSKVMCVFFDIDKMIGNDFEAGLTELKAIAEK